MLIRIVRMTFDPLKVDDFKPLFEEVQPKIRNFPGCVNVELCADPRNPNIFYTYSRWESEEALESYRKSDFFDDTWARTKLLFAGKPEAYSLISEN